MVQKPKIKNSEDNSNRLMILIGMVVGAVVLIAGFIFFLVPNSGSSIDYQNIPQNRTEDGAFILGNPEAAVTIVAWEDYLCPHCQAYEPELERFMADFVAMGKARFEFRMLPISDTSSLVFGLTECADNLKPGSFWNAHKAMFDIAAAGFNDRSPREFADTMELSYSELLNCTSTATQYITDATFARAFTNSAGEPIITGTPTVGWRLNGSEVRFDVISRRPSYNEIAALINTFSQ